MSRWTSRPSERLDVACLSVHLLNFCLDYKNQKPFSGPPILAPDMRRHMQIDLSSKRVIVTGASRGIGRAIARAFAAEGARVAICARTSADLEAVAQDLKVRGASAVIAQSVDVTDTEGVKQFVEQVAQSWG